MSTYLQKKRRRIHTHSGSVFYYPLHIPLQNTPFYAECKYNLWNQDLVIVYRFGKTERLVSSSILSLALLKSAAMILAIKKMKMMGQLEINF